MNAMTSFTPSAAMTRAPSLRGPAEDPGAAKVSVVHTDARPRRSGGNFPLSIDEYVARARAVPEDGKRFAFLAAGRAFDEGLPVEVCPFDPDQEAALRADWVWFYEIQAKARRAKPAAPPAEFRAAPRRKCVPPKVVTTSPAYADQLGIEPEDAT